MQRIADATARAVRDRPAGTTELSAVVASAVGAATREVLAAVDVELKTMDARIKAIEGRGIKYTGTFQRAMIYQRGDVVTHDGSAWIALSDSTRATPGDDASWQLMVKRGKDGR